jgi:NDP-sugar pyrophosphorylase family protein
VFARVALPRRDAGLIDRNFEHLMLSELQAIVLGGLGTRLRSELGDLPKPIVDVGGHPFLELILLHLRSFGIGVVVLAVSHRHECIEEYFGDGASLGISVASRRELQPLGTAGALRNPLSLTQGDQVLVLNGDSFVDADYQRCFGTHCPRLA